MSRLTGTKLVGPKGISAESDGQGRVAVVDNKDCGVVVYGTTGRPTSKIGTRGSESNNNQLAGPQYCAFISSHCNGESTGIVVTDFHNHTVKVCYVLNRPLLLLLGRPLR